mgnify:CR=1 FL=1
MSNSNMVLRRRRYKESKRKNKIDKVDSLLTSLLSLNKVMTDVPGLIQGTKDTQEGLEFAAENLKEARDTYLPIANIAGPVVAGGFAIGSFFVLKAIIEESKNV